MRIIDSVLNNRLISRWSGRFAALLLCFVTGIVFAVPDFPPPPDAMVGLVGESMVVNGIPMHIRQFASKRSVLDVLDFYRQYWPKGTEKKPGYTETDALAPWQIITRVEDGYLMTVQVTEDGDQGSSGLLGLSKLPDPENDLPVLGRDFPAMRGSKVFNDIESKDLGKQGRTLQIFNHFSVETNANFYRDHYSNHGWNIEMDKGFSGGNSHAQRFSNGDRHVIITIQKSRDGSVIVAQTETSGW